jgi:DNA-binding XRE family transcriptional regulator
MNNLKNVRKRNQITQKELAEKIGISKRTISAYETNDRDLGKIELKKAIKITRVLKCRIEDFYNLDE